MHGGRWAGSSRAGRIARVGILAGLVWLLSSGCLVQVLHVSNLQPWDLSGNYPCGRFKPRADGVITIGVDRVVGPNITIVAGLLMPPQNGSPGAVTYHTVWSNGQGTSSEFGSVKAGWEYQIGVTSSSSPGPYYTDVGMIAVIKNANGDVVPIDCVN